MTQFAEQLHALRLKKGYSMQALAELAQVSKSMICKIEQNKVQPTLDVAARLAAALDRTLSEMLHPNVKARTVYIPAGEQAVWHDAQHIIRKLLSPVFEGMTLEWLQVTLPAQTSISCLPMPLGGEKYVYMLKGELEIPVAGEKNLLKMGDSFYFEANHPHQIINPGKKPAEYYLLIKHAK